MLSQEKHPESCQTKRKHHSITDLGYYNGMTAFTRRLQSAAAASNTFSEFTPGTVTPIGALDVSAGAPLPVGATAVRNVGVRPGVTLTPYFGNLTLTSGQVVSGLDIHGYVTTAGSLGTPPTVTDCKIRGVGGTTSDSGLVLGHSYDMSGTVFEWCDFDATGNESGWLNGLSGGNFTVKYSDITRVVDGIHLTQGNVTALCCRMYDGYYESTWDTVANSNRTTTFTDFGGKVWTPPFADQTASGDVHGDGVQVAGSSGNVIRGCYIGGANATGVGTTHLDPTVSADYAAIQTWDAAMCYKNSGIILNALSSNPIGALVELNWLQGGAACLNASTNGSDTGSGVTVQNNRFIRSTGYHLYVQTGHSGTFTGNVYDNDSSAVTTVNF